MSEIIDIQNNNTIKPNSMERMNDDEQAEKYLDGLVEKKECFNHGDMCQECSHRSILFGTCDLGIEI